MAFIKVKAKSVNKDVSRHKIYKKICFCESLLLRNIKKRRITLLLAGVAMVVSCKVTLSSLEPVDDSATAARKRH